jgi:hypothetical protein
VLTGGRDRSRTTGQQAGQWTGEQLQDQDDGKAQPEGQPGGLDALGDGARAVTRTGAAGRTSGGPVSEEVEQRGGPGEEAAADGETAEGDGVQVPDDGGVDEQVQRLRREDDKRRNCQGQDRGSRARQRATPPAGTPSSPPGR